MQVQLLTDLDKVPLDVLSAWDELAGLSALPYATPAWMLAFWREVHEPSGLAEARLIVVRDGEHVIGIGPFFAGEQRPLGLREWWPLGVGIGQRTGPLARPGRAQEVARGIAQVLASQDLTALRLPAVEASTSWAAWLSREWPGFPPPKQLTESVVPAPQVTMRSDGDHEAWLAQRSRNFRAGIARRRRLAARRGGRVLCIDEPGAAPAAMASLFALHHKRSAALGRPSTITREVERAVTAGTVELMASGRARIWVVEAADEIVAADLHVIAGSRMCCFNGGIHPGWTKESLGSLLLEAAVQDAHALGMETLDLGSGNQPFKRRFADADAPLSWNSLLPRGRRYVLERTRLLPGEVSRAAKRAADHLPEAYRDRLRTARRLSERRHQRPLRRQHTNEAAGRDGHGHN